MPKTIYLSIGTNLGDREANLQRALDDLEREGVRIAARSSVYETEPRDISDQPWFLNMAAACETQRFPMELLDLIHRIEREAGRARDTETVARGPRILDIDILLFGDAVVNTPELTIPHPRMLERRFVLEPVLEIAPELRHPTTRALLREYLGSVADQRVSRVIG